MAILRDSYQRTIDYMRISVTDRCNLRCIYCMPAEGVEKRLHEDILSYEEIVRICRAFASAGVRKFRITGGEPLVRRGVAGLIRDLKAQPGIDSVTLTTNGVLLAGLAAGLREAGLDSVNISLDALDPCRYRELTRGGDVRQVLRGIDAALACGFPAVKINCVPFAGGNEDELTGIALMARERPLHVRFIEMMPLGCGTAFLPLGREALRSLLENAFGPLTPAPGPSGNGPAEYFSLPGFCGAIGFIHTLDHAICGQCNRLRLTADGMLKTCLHMDEGISMRPALASGGDDALLREIADAMARKPQHHEFGRTGVFGHGRRSMSRIGG